MSENIESEISIVNYKEFDFDNLIFDVPNKSRAGSYISEGKYEGNDLYIQTPKLKCSSIVKTDNRCAIDLEFDKSHGQFYDFITSIDDYSIIQIQKNSKAWFTKEFPLDVVEEFYKTPVKVGRKNKPPSLKIKVPVSRGVPNVTIYDSKNNIIDFDKIKENTKILVVLKFGGLKFLKQQVICEWIPVQLKSFQSFTQRRNVYLIRDNLLTDDEGEYSRNRDNTSIDNSDTVLKVELVENNEIQNLDSVEETNNDENINEDENIKDTGIKTLSLKDLEDNILTDSLPELTEAESIDTNNKTALLENEINNLKDIETAEVADTSAADTSAADTSEADTSAADTSAADTSAADTSAQETLEEVETKAQETCEVSDTSEVSDTVEAVTSEAVTSEAVTSEAVTSEAVTSEAVTSEAVTSETLELLENVETNADKNIINTVEIIKEELDKSKQELKEIEEELNNNEYNLNDSMYDDYDLGLSDDELSEVDLLSINIPEKNIILEESNSNSENEQLNENVELRNKLAEKEQQVKELQEYLKGIMNKLN